MSAVLSEQNNAQPTSQEATTTEPILQALNMPGVIAFVLVVGYLILVALGVSIPSELSQAMTTVIVFYFGSHLALTQQLMRGRSNNDGTQKKD